MRAAGWVASRGTSDSAQSVETASACALSANRHTTSPARARDRFASGFRRRLVHPDCGMWKGKASKIIRRSAPPHMNHLAHLFLAAPTAESLIGNLAGDFVKGRIGDRFPPAIADGIAQHRRIDAFTDSHPSVAAFRRVLIPDHGH